MRYADQVSVRLFIAVWCFVGGSAQLLYAAWFKRSRLAGHIESISDPVWQKWKKAVSVGVAMILIGVLVLVIWH